MVPSADVLNILGTMPRETPRTTIENAEQAASFARRLLDSGVDGIKLHSISDPSILAGAVAEAHRSGKPVFCHPAADADGLLAAVRSGVDVVAHTTPWTGPWDAALVKEMRERNVALIPTLTIWRYLRRHDRLSSQEQVTGTTVGQLRAWHTAGGTLLFGTDAGAVPDDPSEEYALMAEAGLSFRDILASLTTAPAQRFGDKDAGRIAPGLRADLVVLKSDPARDESALAAVQYTLRAGKVVYRASEPPTSRPRPR
jgi:imidazolonepropionase-like amidohydrolase